MATPADQRLLELLDKWLKSLELHIQYSSLDEGSYWRVQSWVEHQRPTRWILDLAKQKTLALRGQVEARSKAGDAGFADSLELMTFLANLVGSEHLERFIPLAEAQGERPLAAAVAEQSPDPAQSGTREMPKFTQARREAPPVATATVARSERKTAAAAKSAAKMPHKQPAKKTSPAAAHSAAAHEQVIADAMRLVQWGRKWYELPELIARMADRPPLPEVRRILKEHKQDIDAQAGKA